MKLYSARIRIAGSLLNETPRINLTAAEIEVLRVLHGDADGVVDIKHTGEIDRTSGEERARLEYRYNAALAKFDAVRNLNGVFGARGALPDALEDVEHDDDDVDALADAIRNAPRTRKTKKRA